MPLGRGGYLLVEGFFYSAVYPQDTCTLRYRTYYSFLGFLGECGLVVVWG